MVCCFVDIYRYFSHLTEEPNQSTMTLMHSLEEKKKEANVRLPGQCYPTEDWPEIVTQRSNTREPRTERNTRRLWRCVVDKYAAWETKKRRMEESLLESKQILLGRRNSTSGCLINLLFIDLSIYQIIVILIIIWSRLSNYVYSYLIAYGSLVDLMYFVLLEWNIHRIEGIWFAVLYHIKYFADDVISTQ